MRISDWSSDVCSSDLLYRKGRLRPWNSPELLMLREPPERLPSRQDYSCDSKWSADETRNSPGASTFSSSTTPSFTSIAKRWPRAPMPNLRSEEHTSELQSLMRISYAVFCLKKKNNAIRSCE